MQRALAQNCLATNWDSLMNFEQSQGRQVHEEIGQFINNGGGGLQLDIEINEIVRESFKTTKKYIWKGVFSFLFYFAALFTLKDGLLPIMAHSFPGTRSEHIDTHLSLDIQAASSIKNDESTEAEANEENPDAE